VDPDTLRRWANEGRVPAFTTPGGHRRFERRALERIVASRRTGPASGLAALGASPDRLNAAYRRRYGEAHGVGLDPRAMVPASQRATYRDAGRRLVDALIRHLDETGAARATAERDADRIASEMGARLATGGVPLGDAVAVFVAARRPFLAELSIVARRRGVDAARVGRLYDTSTGLLDRLLLAFVAAHAATTDAGSADAPGADGALRTAEPSPGA
jgi:hypothetical protein